MRGSGTLPARNSCLFTGENAAFVEHFLRELKDADCFLRILCVGPSPPYVYQPGSFDMCENRETPIAKIRPLQFRILHPAKRVFLCLMLILVFCSSEFFWSPANG